MKIKSIHIEKFRSIQKADINFSDVNAIVGENNTGKTSILLALNAFFNFRDEKIRFENQTHRYAARMNTYITVTFSDVSGILEFQNYVLNDELNIQFQYSYSENKKSYYYIKNSTKVSVDDGITDIIKNYLIYIYVPTNRNNRDISWSADSLLKEYVMEYARDYTQNRDNISVKVKQAGNSLHSSILSKIEKQLKSLYLQDGNGVFSLEYSVDLDYKYLLDKLSISYNENGNKFSLVDCGSGVISMSIIALFRAKALLSNKSVFLAIEEPEQNLHPQAQKSFIKYLKENKNELEVQAIFTTHSPVMINELGYQDIILVRKIKDIKRGYKTKTTQLSTSFLTRYGINDVRSQNFFSLRNGDFFFSRFVVITESPIDAQVFINLISPKIPEKASLVSFISLDGVANAKYPYFLLKELELPFCLIVDKDFYVDYTNDQLEKSRSPVTGLPQYKTTVTWNDILEDIYDTSAKKSQLNAYVNSNYRLFFDNTKESNILSLHYNLESDLTLSRTAQNLFYAKINVPAGKRNALSLRTEYYKSIKKRENVMHVINGIPKKSLPESFQKIANHVVSEINKVID